MPRESVVSMKQGSLFELPPWVPQDAWEGYLEMRRKIRAPLTDRARTITLNRLAALMADGYDPGAVLDQSTERCWTSVFPLKEKSNGKAKEGRIERVLRRLDDKTNREFRPN